MVATLLPLTLAAACTTASGAGGGGGGGGGSASSPANFAGKTVTLLVPTSAGGGLDGIGRAVAQYLGNYLPGNPRVIVDNVDGGGGAVGLHQLDSVLPANGLYVGLEQSPQLLRYVFKATGFNFDMTSFIQLGSLRDGGLVTTSKKLGTNVKTLAGGAPVVIGNADPGGIGGLVADLGFKVLKIPYKMVFGYSGTGPIGLAMVRNDVGATSTTYAGFLKTFQPEGNLALYQSGYPASSPGQLVRDTSGSEAGVPTVEDLYKQAYGTEPSGPDWDLYQTVVTLESLGTAFVVRPGTPANFVTALTQGLAKMATDPGAKVPLTKLLGHAPEILGPAATQKVENAYFQLPASSISQLKTLSGLSK